ncbi:MAG: hypothetical protein WA110_03005 [Anaerolineaceae bacterium]
MTCKRVKSSGEPGERNCCPNPGGEPCGLPWWGRLLVILVPIVLLWLFSRPRKEAQEKPPVQEVLRKEPEAAGKAVPAPDPSAQQDDLTLIKGIGPRIQACLREAGISSFDQLTRLDAGEIKQIITAAGIRLGDTGTWPEQARLAALGRLDALKTYQENL